MKIIIVFLAIGLLIALAGCAPVAGDVKSIMPVTSTIIVKEIAQTSLVPCDYDYFWIGQDIINIGDMHPGAVVDTWTSDIAMVNGYQYKKGDPLCFTIYNNLTVDQSYMIELDNNYYGQPPNYADWITISTLKPIVPPRMAMNIPVKLQIPPSVNETINHRWEFRIGVIPEGTGSIQFASWARFIITMKNK